MSREHQDVTTLLLDWNRGNKEALDLLMPLVVGELRQLAKSHLIRERRDHTLQPTALVNEAYLRLVDRRRVDWKCRAHFFAFAARTMRRILIEHARAQRAAKRGGGVRTVTLREVEQVDCGTDVDLLALDDALRDLAVRDERQSRLVELRFFAGLSVRESAAAMGISVATVSREWAHAKAWLYRELAHDTPRVSGC